MPYRKRSNIRRKRRVLRKRRGMKRMGRRLNANRQDRATVIETQELTVVPEGGNYVQHNLGQYARATAVAKNFRFFRCKKVELEFIPYANVFAPGQAFPELYFQVDRVQGSPFNGVPLPLPTKAIMLARGTTPVKWTSVIKKSYSPSVLRNENFIQNVVDSQVTAIGAVSSTPVFYKWYATQQYQALPPFSSATQIEPTWAPNQLTYFGAVYFVDQPLVPPGAVLGTIKMKTHWEFKEPNWTVTPSDPVPE